MLKNENNLFKNTVIIGIGTICTKFISFIMLPLYTNWLLPEEYGNYDLIVSYLSLLIPIITLQLEQAIFRFSLKNQENSKKYFSNAFFITIVNIIVIDIIALNILRNSIFKYSFILYFDAYAIFVLIAEYLRGNNKLKEYSLYNILTSISIVITNIILVYKLKFGAVGLMYSYALSYGCIDLFVILKEKIYIAFNNKYIEKATIKEMLKYSYPMIPNGISWWITNVSDRTMIKIFIGSFYNGLYAVSCKIPTIMSLIYSIFNLSWQQTAILVNDDKGKKEYYSNVFKKLIYFLFTCALMIISLLPLLYNYIISREYYESMKYVSLLLLGAVFLSLAQFLSGILLAQNDTKKIGYSTVVSAFINIAVNLMFMKRFGIIIAAISTLISYIYLFVKRFTMIYMCEKKKNIVLIIIMSVIFIVSSYIIVNISNLIVNLILVIISIVAFLVFNKELIIMIFQKGKSKIMKNKLDFI